MLDIALIVATLLSYAFLSGVCISGGTHVLDRCLDYPSPLWKFRYWKALSMARGINYRPPMPPGTPEEERITIKLDSFVATSLDVARTSEYDQQGDVMAHAYEVVAAHVPAFKRWICPYCMSVFIGLPVSLVVGGVLLPLYGWWVALYWFTVFPMIGICNRILE